MLSTHSHNSFITFLEALHAYDPILINTVYDGYTAIYESSFLSNLHIPKFIKQSSEKAVTVFDAILGKGRDAGDIIAKAIGNISDSNICNAIWTMIDVDEKSKFYPDNESRYINETKHLNSFKPGTLFTFVNEPKEGNPLHIKLNDGTQYFSEYPLTMTGLSYKLN